MTKLFYKYIMTLTALLLTVSAARAAGEVHISTLPTGGGTLTSAVANGVCTLTAVPADGYYLTVDYIKAVKSVSGTQAQVPRRAPIIDDTPITITPANPDANPGGVTTYTFDMPGADYDVEVTAEFQAYYQYGLVVNGVAVTEGNNTDVLGDGTVSFDGRNTLVLNKAELSNVTTSLDELIIFLSDENTVGTIVSTKEGGSSLLTFTTDATEPGRLTLKTEGETAVVTGFAESAFDQNLALISGALTEQEAHIGTPIKPIVTENNETQEVEVAKEVSQSEDLSNVTINEVLYTLEQDNGDGVNSMENCIELASTMAGENMDAVVSEYQPGTKDFADNYSGLTFMIPAGTGNIIINVKTGAEGVLHLKIGTEEPYVITGAEDFTDFTFPYACTEATYVYLYNASQAASNAPLRAPNRAGGKKATTTVGVRSVGVSAAAVQQSSNAAAAASIGLDNQLTEDDVRATIQFADGGAVIDNINVTSLPDNLFAGQSYMNSVDLRKTSISGLMVSRSAGAFNELSKNTFIFVPAGNSTTEPNVIIGQVCELAKLDAQMPDGESFAPADGFTAQKVVLDRTFAKDEMATVYVPFNVDYLSASQFGTFYTFGKTANGFVKIEEVKEDLQANTPYVFKSADDNVQLAMKVARISLPVAAGAPAKAPAADGLVGCYSHFTGGTDAYRLEIEGDDVQFVRMAAGDKVLPFQAYLQLSGETADLLRVTDDEGVLTGIVNVKAAKVAGEWNTLDGLRLTQKPAKKGIYIHEGRKFVVK